MARTPDPGKRVELLRAVVGHLAESGVNDLSLAPLAEAIGTSKRMLLYYFGDRGELISQVLEASRPDVGKIFDGVNTRDQLAESAMQLWHALTRGDQRHSVRMLLQVLSLAATDPGTYGEHARTAVEVILTPITAAFVTTDFTPGEAAARATLVVSGLRGLCQDLLVTNDGERLDTAARLLVDAAVHGGSH
ncbi:AcrR family transcriptional regulator [Nocardia sp. GAS34]|uniref:TetR/AcrR family transcriptional regulator n=1 Tax=unclassified Nocardia TaxID=2637762 RepID=UPI003D23C1DF